MSEKMSQEAEMRAVLAEHEASGLSMRAFGRQRGMSPNRLWYWKKKLQPEIASKSAFAEIKVAASPLNPGPAITVQLAKDRRIHVCPGFNAAELSRIIGVLERC
jgi:hypothetical protein